MRSSLKLFTWLGIPVHLHWSFALIFVYALWIGFANNLDATGTLWVMAYFMAVFGCVLLHEYGHALMARRYGVQTQDIILTPIGGIARLERMPEKPIQEFLVAIAGPLVNVAIAGVLFGLAALLFRGEHWELFRWFIDQFLHLPGDDGSGDGIGDAGVPTTGLLFYFSLLLVTNIVLVIFNMVPAFPMDGGRIFRSLLAIRLGRVRATRIASLLGQAVAVGFVYLGLTGTWGFGITLAFIGFFVFTTARAENSMVRLDSVLRRFKARDLLRPNFTRLSSNDWMQTPVGLLRQGLERHFLVFDINDILVGVLEEADIVSAMKKNDLSAEIGQYAHRNVQVVTAEQGLDYVYHMLQQRGAGIIAVADAGTIVGVIDRTGLQNFLRLQL